jgi:hypothetical protein
MAVVVCVVGTSKPLDHGNQLDAKEKMMKKNPSTLKSLPMVTGDVSEELGVVVTKEFLIDLHEKQKGKCAICNEEPKTVRGLHIDHCHKTGKVRGLLCHGCNVALGSFKEDVTLLNKAIEYIRSF